jgi:hypothetical protein
MGVPLSAFDAAVLTALLALSGFPCGEISFPSLQLGIALELKRSGCFPFSRFVRSLFGIDSVTPNCRARIKEQLQTTIAP